MSDNPEALPELPDPHTILRRGDGTLSAVLFTLEQMTAYARTYARAALAQQAATPPGWKLVPIEPTGEMIEQGAYEFRQDEQDVDPANLYRAMLMVAPAAPKEAA